MVLMDSPMSSLYCSLIIVACNPCTSVGMIPSNSVSVNYQYFDVDADGNITIGWNNGAEICSTDLELHGFTLSSLANGVQEAQSVTRVPAFSDNMAIISATSQDEDPVVYRIVALDENRMICSDNSSKITFYKLIGE